MGKAVGALSVMKQSIKYKLKIAFYLMSVLPLLVSVYLCTAFVAPRMGVDVRVVIALGVSVVIALCGFLLIKQIFDRVLAVTHDAKLLAAGDLGYHTTPLGEDEVGDLRIALNNLSERIRTNMLEVKQYSEHTSEINIEMQRRMLVFSGLLQMSSLIAQSAKPEVILRAAVERCRLLADSEIACLLLKPEGEDEFSVKVSDGIPHSPYLLNIRCGTDAGVFKKVVQEKRVLVIDRENKLPDQEYNWFFERFRVKNALFMPVIIRSRVVGVLAVGNSREGFTYTREDTEFLDIFAKQVAISIENDMLSHQVEKLEIKDELTGLYNESFIRARLQEEIRRSITYQRPCGFVLMNIDGFQKYRDTYGQGDADNVLKKVASMVRDSVSEIDPVGRTDLNEFAIILPEKNKRHAQTTAETIRKKIEFTFGEEPDTNKRITISGGVSENPLDGIKAEELMAKAKSSLNLAKMQGQNRILG